jgi:branched-chain amino acid aminotransferase
MRSKEVEMISNPSEDQKGIVYLNGEYVEASQAKISILDRGFIFGDAAYDIGRTFKHQPYRWEEHIDRLFCSLRYIQIDPGLTPKEIYHITEEVLERNRERLAPNEEFMVMWRISRGVGLFWSEVTEPTVIVHCYKIPFAALGKKYIDGANLIISSTRRVPPQCLDPKAKLQNKLNHIVAELEARSIDPAAYVLMLDIDGRLSECSSQNFFIVRQGKLLTSKRDNILGGIARRDVMELATELDIEFIETDLYPFDLQNADEIFVTANSICMVPISKINCRPVEKPVPGPITRRLFSAWSEKLDVDIVGLALSHVKE